MNTTAQPQRHAFDLSDDALKDAAAKASESMHRHLARWMAFGTPEDVIHRQLRSFARSHGIPLPNKPTRQQVINRMTDAAWWRRALRKRFRSVEHAAIIAGRVHKHAGVYVSDHAMRRAIRDQKRIEALLAALNVTNQNTGEVLALDEVQKASLSNPENRRKYLMARIKGIENHCNAKGDEAYLLTITCPSRFHARHFTGQANDRYGSTGPRHAQSHLCKVWKDATRKLSHDGVQICGLRVVEPHHESCPHWHVLAFTPPEHSALMIDTLRAYALRESPDEPGAAERRFTAERIDPARGSAVGYVAKYVSKNIDGHGIDVDEETGLSGASSAARATAWSRLWGIRQFQFFGVPAITPVRELHRLDSVGSQSPALTAIHQAVKDNDYAAVLCAIETYGLGFQVDYTERDSTRYPDEKARRITGLTAQACDLPAPTSFITRTDEWRIEPKKRGVLAVAADAAFPPWTRFNNCAPLDFEGFFPTATSDTDAEKDSGQRVGIAPSEAPRETPSTDDLDDWFYSEEPLYAPHQEHIFDERYTT